MRSERAAVAHRAYDAGNYDEAYAECSVDEGLQAARDSVAPELQHLSEASYLLGRFSSHTVFEVPADVRDEYICAALVYGPELVEYGIAAATAETLSEEVEP